MMGPTSPLDSDYHSTFLDPPSYADVIFSPSSSPTALSGDSPSLSGDASPRRTSASPYLQISVSDPQKEHDPSSTSLLPGAPSSSFLTYLVTTTILPSRQTLAVRRRFRDVVTLADRLAEAHRGLFVPLRPDKSLVDGNVVLPSADFVEQRRSAIERYLRRLAAHPVIGRSDELRVFLSAKGKLPLPTSTDVASRMLDGAVRLPRQLFGDSAAAQVAPQDAVQPAKGGRDLLRIFKELKQAVVTDWGGVKPMVVEEDKEFLEKKGRMQELAAQLGAVSQQAEGLVRAQQDIGETVGDLGLAFIKLTKFETEEAIYNCQRTRAADIKRVATAAVKASRLYRELNSQTVKHLDILHEYLELMLAVQGAFAERASALLTVQTLMSDLSSLQTRAEKHEVASSRIFGGDKSRLRKVDELRETIRVTEDAKNCAMREYERIKENNRSELERLEGERHEDFLNMVKGFVINQVGYSEKIANVWATVAEETSGYERDSEVQL